MIASPIPLWPADNLTDAPAAEQVRDGGLYTAPAMGILCDAPWTHPTTSRSVHLWRELVGPLFRPIEAGALPSNYLARPYPLAQNPQPLVNALMRDELLSYTQTDPAGGTESDEVARPGPGDRTDLSRWIGVALAFDHNEELALMEPRANAGGTHTLNNLLNSLMEESSALAWYGQPVPGWAYRYVREANTRIRTDEILQYRPWADVQNDLMVLLEAFQCNTPISHRADQGSDEAVQGALALRLLASVVPGRVDDQLVEQLVWLDQNIQSYIFPEDQFSQKYRQLIEASWDRSLLERGAEGRAVLKDTDATKESGAKRRRTL